ncbi:early nodule-specific protein 2-like [Arachis stenosperma]|uniref:early nodule-specific protein 2-like n=1 Tax=Arachis stenosperma TaxID=217475 RepID=UPI0025AB9049|nr:early nodule-specific protein 2-like [Arachis stenosperma]
MNSHPSSFEFGSNCVEGNVNLKDNMHQGWNNQGWEEPQAYGQPSWQQPPPVSYRYNSNSNAYQSNRRGSSCCTCRQPPPHAYGPSHQHDPQPYSQTPFNQIPSHDSYPSYDQSPIPHPYDQYEQEPLEPPQSYHDYYQEPPQYTPPPYFEQEEPPFYDESFLQNDEPSYPPQA